jgi:methionyl-tRNA formyltransferase
MKIAILATDSASTWIVVNALKASYSDIWVVLEQPVSRFRLLRNRMRKLGRVAVLGQLFFMLYLPLLRWRSRTRLAQLIRTGGLSTTRPADPMVSEFESANSSACHARLRELAPDVVVVNGTRILSRETLSACSAVFLNTHCGITPAYRGVHGAYWALAQGDAAHAGVTVHVVDPGIDTGNIVYQQRVEMDQHDNFVTYPVQQYVAAIPLLLAALRDVSAGKLKTYRREDLTSALWYHPTLWQYMWTRLLRGVR